VLFREGVVERMRKPQLFTLGLAALLTAAVLALSAGLADPRVLVATSQSGTPDTKRSAPDERDRTDTLAAADATLAASVPSATQPAAPAGTTPLYIPSTQPAITVKPSPPIPSLYKTLLTRSLFANPRAEAVVASHSVTTANGAGATLVLRGVGVRDGVRVAYIEDIQAKKISRHQEGEMLAGGRIGALTIDEMTLLTGAAAVQVRPGCNLLGQPVAAPTPPATQPSPAGGDAGPRRSPRPTPPQQPQPATDGTTFRFSDHGQMLQQSFEAVDAN
jgi:hypothetical protein